jgi:cyclic-di-GMP-binding protein
MDEQVRVTGKKIDDLQKLISMLEKSDLGIPLQFENFRN